jgi:hypothetical protein
LNRGSVVLLTLLPAALGIALGAGQGSTLAKAVLPRSRLPSRLAGIVVLISLPVLTALLGVINQLLASPYGTLLSVSLLGMVSVWLPLEAFEQPSRALRQPLSLKSATARGAANNEPSAHRAPENLKSAVLEPSDHAATVKAIGRLKWRLTAWMLLGLLWLVFFLGFTNAASLVSEHLQELKTQIDLAVRVSSRRGDWGPLMMLLAPMLQMVLQLIAKTYLAQVFYTDTACVAITQIWHADRADCHTTEVARNAELAEVAKALDKQRADRRSAAAENARIQSNEAIVGTPVEEDGVATEAAVELTPLHDAAFNERGSLEERSAFTFLSVVGYAKGGESSSGAAVPESGPLMTDVIAHKRHTGAGTGMGTALSDESAAHEGAGSASSNWLAQASERASMIAMELMPAKHLHGQAEARLVA